ncbi:MAG: serine hydrolase [Dehalococcoidales bacterium]|nr:serine hydrolase [Dehalococcoidales bacterium]
MLFVLPVLTGCGPSTSELEAIDYTPEVRDGWQVSTPEAEGLDPDKVKQLYYDAGQRETLYSLLVVRNGKLVAEEYFNQGSIDELGRRASVTKSYTSALMSIAIEQGYVPGIDAKMLDYFPDVADRITDPRKKDITVRDMLKMRSGYPWEETDDALWAAIWTGEYMTPVVTFPLTADPGTRFQYSNLCAHWVGVIVARATGTDLMTFGKEYLFNPLGVTPGEDWNRDVDGYYIGGGDIMFTARDMAKFGQLYLDGGRYKGQQLISEEWVRDSLATYSVNEAFITSLGHFHDIGYGYMWWSALVDGHYVNFAWGHGGQLIVLVDELDMVIVTTADPFYGRDAHFDSWSHESKILKMVSDFIHDLFDE